MAIQVMMQSDATPVEELLETALIMPLIGVNRYVVHGVRGRGQMHDVMLGALPFVGAMFVMITLLMLFPDIAMWLPKQLYWASPAGLHR